MRTTVTPGDCAAALDRLSLKLDQAHALLESLPPVDPAAADELAPAARVVVVTGRLGGVFGALALTPDRARGRR
jgi:hypothetical protein